MICLACCLLGCLFYKKKHHQLIQGRLFNSLLQINYWFNLVLKEANIKTTDTYILAWLGTLA